ncbi:hypothetical protein C0Q70_02165 [Pomacea canaliculata]|uniref:GH18 domain-containing protein n=1 Tax=Pomacea canaliculata TaxID=400727 RepID=A0A2T7Q1I0_POMCA|nr:hypothetical protein C0Q70_02165 [Pomacea canaliculata]
MNERRAKSQEQEPRAKSQEPRAKSQEPRAKSQEPRAKSQEPKPRAKSKSQEPREPRAKSQEPKPRAKSQEPRAKSKPRAKSQEPRAKSQEPRPRAKSQEPKSQEPRARAKSQEQEPRAKSQEPRAKEPRAKSQEPRAKAKPRAKSQEPRAKSQEPRAKSQEPRAKSQEPRAKSQEPRAKSQEPRAKRAKSQEPRAKSQEPRAKSQEPRAKSQEPRAKSQEPRAKSKSQSQEPRAKSKSPKPRAKSQDPRAKSQEPRAKSKSQEPRARAKSHKSQEPRKSQSQEPRAKSTRAKSPRAKSPAQEPSTKSQEPRAKSKSQEPRAGRISEMLRSLPACVAALVAVIVAGQVSASLRRVCYYTNWAQYRNGKGRYVPENVDPFMCTHYIYAFSAFDENNRIRAFEWNDESQPWAIGMYEQFNQLKLKNPALKTLLAVGGWNVGSGPFTQMVATQQSRARFIESAIEFVRKWGFDGLDVDWEYPANRGSPPEDRDNFTFLIKELRAAFESESLSTGRPRLLLSAAVGAGKSKIDTAYNIPALMLYLDFASIMSYDLHGAWETHTGHHTALFPRSDETGDDRYLNVDFAVNYWVQLGAPKEKLNVGLSTYWRTFTLSSTSQTGVRHAEQWRPEHQDREQFVPYVTKGDQWAGGDDVASITTKTCYVKQHGFGGVMVWTPDDDDFSGTSCPEGKYPLMTAIIKELNNPSFANCPGVIPPTDKVPTRPTRKYRPVFFQSEAFNIANSKT